MPKGAIPHYWACEKCVYAADRKRRCKKNAVSTCTCRLNGHSYGNVISCPHRKEGK